MLTKIIGLIHLMKQIAADEEVIGLWFQMRPCLTFAPNWAAFHIFIFSESLTEKELSEISQL
ncbi:hypothetical protein H4S14_003373 [Agrobacterium vitis]|nr:hypothetical protein [Agrobacterium vitis]MBE1439608.1 hypothetical protein [Agrobacterium vitis]